MSTACNLPDDRHPMTVVQAALVQSEWTGDKESMIEKNFEYARQAAEQGPRSCASRRSSQPLLLHRFRTRPITTPPRRSPTAPPSSGCMDLARETGMVIVVPIYEKVDEGRFYNTAAVIDSRRPVPGQVPQDPHPSRQGVLGEVLLPAGQPRLPDLRHRSRTDRRLHLLRPPLPRRMAGAGAQGRQDRLQPLRHQPRASSCTYGISNSRRPRSPTSISSGRSTGSDEKTCGDTDYYGSSYFVDPRGQIIDGTASDTKDEVLVRDLDMT